MPIGLYRLINPTRALCREGDRHVCHTVPTGAQIRITDEAFNETRLVTVEWAGVTVMMFAEDLKTRTERVLESKA